MTPSDAIFKNIRCVTNGLPNDASPERRVFWVHETKVHVADAHAERPRAPGAVDVFGWCPTGKMQAVGTGGRAAALLRQNVLMGYVRYVTE